MPELIVQSPVVAVYIDSPTLVQSLSPTQYLAARATALASLMDVGDDITATKAEMQAIVALKANIAGIDAMLEDPAYAKSYRQLELDRAALAAELVAADEESVLATVQANAAAEAALVAEIHGIDATLEAMFYSTASLDPATWRPIGVSGGADAE
jgi:hypothetical protein